MKMLSISSLARNVKPFSHYRQNKNARSLWSSSGCCAILLPIHLGMNSGKSTTAVLEFANNHFASRIPGWKTDRGRVYIKFGPPDELDSHPAGQTPHEKWRYRFIDGIGPNAVLEFSDPSRTGDYPLTAKLPEIGTSQDGALARFAAQQRTVDVSAPAIPEPGLAPGTYTILPMQVQVDYLHVTTSSTMTNITAQFANRDLQPQLQDGRERSQVKISGRIVTLMNQPVITFEKTIESATPVEQLPSFMQLQSAHQESVPLAPGQYRLSLVAKDPFSGKVNVFETTLDVPGFEDGKLTASSLILADMLERVPARTPAAKFTIADMKVRPRIGGEFSEAEKMGVYLQIYNFGVEATSQKVSGVIEYEIHNADTGEKIMSFSEELDAIPNASASQVTIEKLLPLRDFSPGTYTLNIHIVDRSENQTLERQGTFSVSAP